MLAVEVDIGLIKSNIEFIKSVYKKSICAVVKADAYGHGMQRLAKAISDDVYAFAVATVDEALRLVAGGILKKIYVLGAEIIDESLPYNVIPTVCSRDGIERLNGKCRCVSIKVNTGMNRLGCCPTEVKGLYDLAEANGLSVDGIYTHLYNAIDSSAVAIQYDRFMSATQEISKPCIKHFAASSCIFLSDKYHFDMARIGLAMYGYGHEKLVPAMKIKTNVVQITNVSCGEHIGYGDVIAQKSIKIATLRLGYGDGIRRTGRLCFVINGKACYSIGNMCMDMCMVDATGVSCNVGDVAELSIRELMAEYNIIEYEALTMLNSRAKRIYKNDKG